VLQPVHVLFDVFAPTGRAAPVVVEVPHAGLALDPESLSYCIAPACALGQDADLFVDELYSGAAALGATVLAARLSRYACDLNRAEDDLDSLTTARGTAAAAPHGVVWRRTTSGRPALVAPLSAPEIERRMKDLYRPYHQALEGLLAEKQARFGHVVLLCAHSMPSSGRLGERRADVVPGSRGRTTAGPAVLATVEDAAAAANFDVVHDDPYRGGFTTGHHGRPREGRHAIQVELARRTYMDETTLAKTAGFPKAQAFCLDLVERLCRLDGQKIGLFPRDGARNAAGLAADPLENRPGR
jgi:N-formylglutamate deformylase